MLFTIVKTMTMTTMMMMMMMILFSLRERRRLAAAVEELEARGATQVIASLTFNDHDDDQYA